jgi:hypothetical protein
MVILKKKDRLCFIGLHRQDATVGSIHKDSSSNFYKIYSTQLVLRQESRRSLLFGDRFKQDRYSFNPNYGSNFRDALPEVDECLNSKRSYYKLIEKRFR